MDRRRLKIGQITGWTLVEIEAFHRKSADFVATVQSVLGHSLPLHANMVARHGTRCLYLTGQSKYWILARDGEDVADQLKSTLDELTGTFTRLSHSRVCIRIEGEVTPELLAKGIAVDLHPDAFRIDDFVLTGLHHTPVLLHRIGACSYELYVLTTYAVSVWEWLIDAALPFGYDIADRR